MYFVNGDVTNSDDLRRAGIEEAMAAVICPADASNEADMRSILTVMAIESIAPEVRTVVEVNNPAHVEHFRRAKADEIMVTSRIASRLLARSSLYPGLAELVTDIVSGGEGSELYRVNLPDRLHRATRSTSCRPSCGPSTPRPCWPSAAAGAPSSTRRRTSASRSATTPSWSPSRSAPSSPWTRTTPRRDSPAPGTPVVTNASLRAG